MKNVTFDVLNVTYFYKLQVPKTDMRFRIKLDYILSRKLEHLLVCKNASHEHCKPWQSSGCP